jgi:hypothetical protein
VYRAPGAGITCLRHVLCWEKCKKVCQKRTSEKVEKVFQKLVSGVVLNTLDPSLGSGDRMCIVHPGRHYLI